MREVQKTSVTKVKYPRPALLDKLCAGRRKKGEAAPTDSKDMLSRSAQSERTDVLRTSLEFLMFFSAKQSECLWVPRCKATAAVPGAICHAQNMKDRIE